MLHGFATDLARRVEGVPDENGLLLQCIRPAQEKFRRSLRVTAPDFRPFERRYGQTKQLPSASFLSHEEGHEEIGHDDSDDSDDAELVASAPKGPIYIDEVMERAHQSVVAVSFLCLICSTNHPLFGRARTRELPGNFPFVVQQTFIDAIIKQWNTPAHILCKTVYSILTEHVRNLVGLHFGSFGQGGLEQRVKLVHDSL